MADTTRRIVNPYWLSQEQRQILHAQVLKTTIEMGIQSQQREGAVKKCKKRGTKVKAKRLIAVAYTHLTLPTI